MSGRPTLLSMWVVTFNPADFPGKYVIRRNDIGRGAVLATDEFHVSDTLDEVREKVPAGCVMLPRYQQDDPVIVEVWL